MDTLGIPSLQRESETPWGLGWYPRAPQCRWPLCLLHSLSCPYARQPWVFVCIWFCCPFLTVCVAPRLGAGRSSGNIRASLNKWMNKVHLVKEVGWHRIESYFGMRIMELIEPSQNLTSVPHLTLPHSPPIVSTSKKRWPFLRRLFPCG